MNITDINFAIDVLSHPQSGDKSDINKALNIAIELLKAGKEIVKRECVLDKIRAEIEKQEKWLAQAGYNAYNVSIAFESIKHALKK